MELNNIDKINEAIEALQNANKALVEMFGEDKD